MIFKRDFFKELNRAKRYHPIKVLPRGKIAVATPNTSTDIIENLRRDEVAVIPYCLVPYGFREGPEARDHFPMFLKRGPTVEIPTPKSLEEALREEEIGPTRKRLKLYRDLDDEALVAGMSWYCPQDRMHRKVSHNDVLEGMHIYTFSELIKRDKHIDKRHLVLVSEYGIDKENKEGGATAVVSVPSRRREEPYRVKLHHFPFIGSYDKWVWMQLQSEHSDCGRKDFGDVYWQRDLETGKRRKLQDIVFCPHDVAAYLGASAEEASRIKRSYEYSPQKIPLQPFPLFTQETVDFWNKLRSQVFFGSLTHARPIFDLEIEIELGRFLARRNPKKTMYASSKLRDYRWDMSFPVQE